MRFNKKQYLSIFLIIIAFILFLTFNSLCFIFSAILFVIVFNMLDASDIIARALLKKININEQISPILTNTFLILTLICAQSFASAHMAPININYIIKEKSFETELTDIFEKYEISRDSNKELVLMSCALENRLTYIVATASSSEEAYGDSVKRYNNLIHRRKAYIKNLSKINKRNKLAGEKSLVVDIPTLDIADVDIEQTKKRILIYAKQIGRDINNSTCDNSCKYRNIDNASLQIVKEFDALRLKIDNRNFKLTQKEREFDELEKQQRIAEHKLTEKGF